MDPDRTDEIIDPAGRSRVLARGSSSTVMAFRHHPRAVHRDPEEERFERTTVIFTTSGAWGLRCSAGTAEGTPETVVLGVEGRTFRARHPARRALDTTLCVTFASPPAADPWWDLAFADPGAPLTHGIARIQRALAREATDRRSAFALKID